MYLKSQTGCQHAEVTNTGLVIDTDYPCLACSPDALVKISGAQEPLGIAEYKRPYSLARTIPHQTALEAANDVSNKKLFCQAGHSGDLELKKGHDYYFQVQATLAITRRTWCDFVEWTPMGTSVQRITVDPTFREKHRPTLLCYYRKAILPELTLPRHVTGQAIREPFLLHTLEKQTDHEQDDVVTHAT